MAAVAAARPPAVPTCTCARYDIHPFWMSYSFDLGVSLLNLWSICKFGLLALLIMKNIYIASSIAHSSPFQMGSCRLGDLNII